MTAEDAGRHGRERAELLRALRAMEDEVGVLRRRLAEAPSRVHGLERRVDQLQATLEATSTQNERLVRTLKDAREQIVTLRSEVDRLAQPPSGFGTVVDLVGEGARRPSSPAAASLFGSRSPNVEAEELRQGQEVILERGDERRRARGFEALR
jgi:proteasome-associated ATPase